MANPRKFSEKIALHNRRQTEETLAFEKIMKEVSDVTTRVAPDRSPSKNNRLRINTQALGSFRGGSLPNVSAGGGTAAAATGGANKSVEVSSSKPPDEPPIHPIPNYRQGSRAGSPGGPMRRHNDRKLDTSPYHSSGPYLSPPTDTGWRRTNSDSALHQSAMQGMNVDRNDGSNRGSWSMLQTMNGPDRNPDGRPRSSCEVPRVPGIHIYPSPHDTGMIQIPIGNNTGSLPDLTNVDFPSPINIPLDQDQDSSPYSSSPINTSPSTLSPTSIPQNVRTQGGRFQYTTSVSHPHSNHLAVPISSRYNHHRQFRQSTSLENHVGEVILDGTESYTQLGGIYQQQCPPTSPSPTLQQAAGYRSPRPSPQSSPSLGGRHSAPCSPGAPSPLSNDYQIFSPHQAAQFQQHFEQLSMDWAQLVASLVESGCTWSAQLELDPPSPNAYTDQGAPSPQMAQSHPQNIPVASAMGELSGDAGYYSTSPSQQLVYACPSPGLQNTTPNTPTSLPEIILTDFSGEDSSRQLATDFFTEEQLKEGLGSLDFDELQIFNSSVGIGEIEENFTS